MNDHNLSARDDLSNIYYDLSMKIFDILQRYLPDDAYDKVFSLLRRREDIADDLSSKTEDELERLRYYETVILPACPVSGVVKSIEDLLRPIEPPTEPCERRDCPEFKTCKYKLEEDHR